MKRISCLILGIILLFGAVFGESNVCQAKQDVSSHSYIAVDAKTGETLFSYKKDKKIYPASTTKLLTAYVVCLKNQPNRRITFTKKMKKQVKNGVTNLNLKVGSRYTVRQYLYMLLISSDADAAVALTNGLYGSTKKFVAKMNQEAKKLGMKNSYFDNPVGLDIGDGYKKIRTTASDMSIIARKVMRMPLIRKIVSKKSYKIHRVKNMKGFTIKNTNRFLSKESYNKKLYRIIGTKTGTTKAAGHALIATAVGKNGREVILAFYGKSTSKKMYRDMVKLFNRAFSENNNKK